VKAKPAEGEEGEEAPAEDEGAPVKAVL